MINALKEIQKLDDGLRGALTQDLKAMLKLLNEHGAVSVYKVSDSKIDIIINDEFNWSSEGLEDLAKDDQLFVAHQFVLGMYMMFTMCSAQHVAVLQEVTDQYEAKLAEKKNLIITPGTSLL